MVKHYHERTKHRPDRYAAGPDTLDWDAQPAPFREFAGSPRVPLPFARPGESPSFAACLGMPAQPVTRQSAGQLLQWSLGLAAWKELGPDRWPLRCNPSSGNLHPTEAYVRCQGIPDLENGLYHYLSREHLLERRRTDTQEPVPSSLAVGLTSIHWREAWKYGERALRYCYLDTGHAMGALRYAALTLGWGLRLQPEMGGRPLEAYLGVDRPEDFGDAEKEHAEVLLDIVTGQPQDLPALSPSPASTHWWGTATRLDPRPLYHWPVIQETARAAMGPGNADPLASTPDPWPGRTWNAPDIPAGTLILRRRSTQRFQRGDALPAPDFFAMLDALLPRPQSALDFWPWAPRVHLLLLVHRVHGLEPGLFALPRRMEAGAALQEALDPAFSWSPVAGAPEHLPIRLLYSGDLRRQAHTLCCYQSIAADGHFTVIFLAEYDGPLQSGAWQYPRLFHEAGLLGQILYMEAEMHGVNGTGIGCFFDDAVHGMLGLKNRSFQDIYHFAVGRALTDPRIRTGAPYSVKQERRDPES